LLFERHHYAVGRALGLAVEDRFDIVAVRVQQEGGVVAGVIGPLPRRAVVGSARRQSRRVEGLDHGPVPGLEGQMAAPGRSARCGDAVHRRDEQLIGPEEAFRLAADRHAQGFEHRAVEAAAGLKVGRHQLQMVDQPAAVQLLRLHDPRLLSVCDSNGKQGGPFLLTGRVSSRASC